MALPTAFRDALGRLYDLITGEASGCVSERFSYLSRMWKARAIWRRDDGKIRIDITIEER